VRAVCTPWERGDFSSVEWAHPEIEFAFADGPTPGTWTGVAAMNDAWRETLTAFESLDVKVEQYLPLNDERVLVLMHNTGRGEGERLRPGATDESRRKPLPRPRGQGHQARPLLRPRTRPRSRGAVGVTHDAAQLAGLALLRAPGRLGVRRQPL
jgi:hypothetical protein